MSDPQDDLGKWEAMPASGAPRFDFLERWGVPRASLDGMWHEAAAARAWPDRLLLARGEVSEDLFYQALSLHLGLPFLAAPVRCAAPLAAIEAGIVRLPPGLAVQWVLAPTGRALFVLLADMRLRKLLRRSAVAITTPRRLSECVRAGLARSLARDAALRLPRRAPRSSALGGLTIAQTACAVMGGAGLVAGAMLSPAATATLAMLAAGPVFLLASWIRLSACWESVAATRPKREPLLPDFAMPTYTVLVPLFREAHMLPQLIGALMRLDYPRERLEIKLLLEADDGETRVAAARLALPTCFEIIICPPGAPRTKPRALNLGLAVSRGELVVVFDAEDIPEPRQLRRAVASFAAAGRNLACLQARLAIDGRRRGMLGRMFALEYAALFDILLPGQVQLALPVALGGSSNHFRRDALEEALGWDAWNVTEDADLGLRLGRLGYEVGDLDSTTWEEAPPDLRQWCNQRTRWLKGWMQTTLVHLRPGHTSRLDRLGRIALLAATLGVVLPALAGPSLMLVMLWQVMSGALLSPRSWAEALAATMAILVFGAGIAAILVPLALGARRRGLRFGAREAAFAFIHAGLICALAWRAVWELACAPHQWNKTEHGQAPAGAARRQRATIFPPAKTRSKPHRSPS